MLVKVKRTNVCVLDLNDLPVAVKRQESNLKLVFTCTNLLMSNLTLFPGLSVLRLERIDEGS